MKTAIVGLGYVGLPYLHAIDEPFYQYQRFYRTFLHRPMLVE